MGEKTQKDKLGVVPLTIIGTIWGYGCSWANPLFLPELIEDTIKGIKGFGDFLFYASSLASYVVSVGNYTIDGILREPADLANYLQIITNATVGTGMGIYNLGKNKGRKETKSLETVVKN